MFYTYIYIYVCIYIIHHEHTWLHTFKNIQKLVNNKQNMQRLVNNIYSSRNIYIYIYIVSNSTTMRVSSKAFLFTKYRYSRCLNIICTV